MHKNVVSISIAAALLVPVLALAQNVKREEVPGVTNFARVETTVACGGATKAEAIPSIKKLGFASVINLRQATEPGAEIEKEQAAAKEAGINWVHIPFNVSAPAPDVVDRFLAAITKAENQPAFIHCAGGGRAAAMWMIKRVQIDHWETARAEEEATALGMSGLSKTFATNYLKEHKH